MKRVLFAAVSVCALGMAGSAFAADVFGGFYAHGLGTKQPEHGFDTMVGVRTDRIDSLGWLGKPSVHIILSANSKVPTDFAAVGFNWPLPMSEHWYIRPGFGLAYTTGKADVGNAFEPGLSAAERDRRYHIAQTRIDFGSNILFEPELALGYHIDERWALEASYVHLSNGQILHKGKNQGLDDLGFRLAYKFGG